MYQLIALVALQIAAYYLTRPKQQSSNVVPGAVEGTTVDASSPIPVLFGTRLFDSTNLVWYGDKKTRKIEQCS